MKTDYGKGSSITLWVVKNKGQFTNTHRMVTLSKISSTCIPSWTGPTLHVWRVFKSGPDFLVINRNEDGKQHSCCVSLRRVFLIDETGGVHSGMRKSILSKELIGVVWETACAYFWWSKAAERSSKDKDAFWLPTSYTNISPCFFYDFFKQPNFCGHQGVGWYIFHQIIR